MSVSPSPLAHCCLCGSDVAVGELPAHVFGAHPNSSPRVDRGTALEVLASLALAQVEGGPSSVAKSSSNESIGDEIRVHELQPMKPASRSEAGSQHSPPPPSVVIEHHPRPAHKAPAKVAAKGPAAPLPQPRLIPKTEAEDGKAGGGRAKASARPSHAPPPDGTRYHRQAKCEMCSKRVVIYDLDAHGAIRITPTARHLRDHVLKKHIRDEVFSCNRCHFATASHPHGLYHVRKSHQPSGSVLCWDAGRVTALLRDYVPRCFPDHVSDATTTMPQPAYALGKRPQATPKSATPPAKRPKGHSDHAYL